MHLVRAAQRARHAHRFADPLRNVVLEAGFAHVRAGILPARDVDVEALVEQVLHQALLRLQVQHVELVDARRDDDDRRRAHLRRRRRVVDQLEQPVAENDRARRGGEVLADREFLLAGHADRAGLDILHEDLVTTPQAFAAGFGGLPHRHRVGEQKIGRRKRIEPLPPPEGRAPALLRRQARRLEQGVLHLPRVEKVPLLDEGPTRILRPRRVAEALVIGLRTHDVRHIAAGESRHAVDLERGEVRAAAHEMLPELQRMRQPRELRVQDGRDRCQTDQPRVLRFAAPPSGARRMPRIRRRYPPLRRPGRAGPALNSPAVSLAHP